VKTIGSKRSYALIWCMPNNDDDDYITTTANKSEQTTSAMLASTN